MFPSNFIKPYCQSLSGRSPVVNPGNTSKSVAVSLWKALRTEVRSGRPWVFPAAQKPRPGGGLFGAIGGCSELEVRPGIRRNSVTGLGVGPLGVALDGHEHIQD